MSKPSSVPIPTMILAAGRGERLRPLTDHTPKPLLPVAGKPLIQRQIEQLAAAGVKEVVINLHHLGEQIAHFLGDGARFGVRIQYSREVHKLETGGGLLHALPLLGDGPLWLLNGDVVLDLPLAEFPTELPAGSAMHMLLTPTAGVREHGDFLFDGYRVTGWGEDVVYCCLALIRGATVRDFAARHGQLTAFSMRAVFAELIERGALTGQLYHGHWIDIGSESQLKPATALLTRREQPD